MEVEACPVGLEKPRKVSKHRAKSMRFTSEGGSSNGAGGTSSSSSSSSSSFFEEEAKRGRVSSNSRLPPSLQLLPTFQLFLLLFVLISFQNYTFLIIVRFFFYLDLRRVTR